MSFVNNIFSEVVIASLGWTILHSLWQGLIISLVFVFLMSVFKKKNSTVRYGIGVAMMLLMITVSIITFISVYNSEVLKNLLLVNQGLEIDSINTLSGWLSSFKLYFSRHLPSVVTIWLIGTMIFFFKFTGGFLYNQRLKVYRVKEASDPWDEKLLDLCKKMKLILPSNL